MSKLKYNFLFKMSHPCCVLDNKSTVKFCQTQQNILSISSATRFSLVDHHQIDQKYENIYTALVETEI